MRETKNKIQTTYSLDREIIMAFDSFCPPGERSTTINELLKDFLQKKKKLLVSPNEELIQKQLEATKAMQEYESLKNEIETKQKLNEEFLESQRVAKERKDFFSSKNEEARRLARLEVLQELNLVDGMGIPASSQVLFTTRWRLRTEEKLRELLALEKEVVPNA